MERRNIGRSGIEAGGIGLGAWAIGGGLWWGDNDDRMSIDTIHRALELGINWVDTARVYGFGHSEEVVGSAGFSGTTKTGSTISPGKAMTCTGTLPQRQSAGIWS